MKLILSSGALFNPSGRTRHSRNNLVGVISYAFSGFARRAEM
ncbi:MAG TPA: hypothetical protein VE870_12535 [Bacteroidales bacterium]|nr:hypothetical protein [Bacteroidales bacterium]